MSTEETAQEKKRTGKKRSNAKPLVYVLVELFRLLFNVIIIIILNSSIECYRKQRTTYNKRIQQKRLPEAKARLMEASKLKTLSALVETA